MHATNKPLPLLRTAISALAKATFLIFCAATGGCFSTLPGGTSRLIVKDADTATTIPDFVIEEEHWHIGLSLEGHGEGPTGGKVEKTLKIYRVKSGDYITQADVTKQILIPFGSWTGLINNGIDYTIWAQGYFPEGIQDKELSRSAKSKVSIEIHLHRSHPKSVRDQRVLAGCAMAIRDNLLPTAEDPLLRTTLLRIAINYFEILLSEPLPGQMEEGRLKILPPFGDEAQDSLPKLRQMLAAEGANPKAP